jgi:hypothetical protein
LLWPWAAAWSAVWIAMPGQSWHFFAQGGGLLLGSGPGTGLQLYALHPDLQIGPLALIVSAFFQPLGTQAGEIAALSLMSLTGPLVLAGVWRLLPRDERPRRFRLLFAGLVFLPVWAELTTHFGHLDDLLALCLSVVAMHAVARRHPVWAGLAIAAAADCKPWAAAFVLPRRQWLTALATFAGGLALVWLPFLAGDPKTLTVIRFTIPNDASSALRALGVMDPMTPWWDRSTQLALGVAGGCVAVWRGRWQAVPLIAMSARIMLDPGVYAYYTSGVLLGAVTVDLVLARWRLPWTTIAGAALLYAARSTHVLIPFSLHELGVLRLVFAVGAPVAVLVVPSWWIARRRGRHARADDTFSVVPPVPPAARVSAGTGPLSWPADGWEAEDSWPELGHAWAADPSAAVSWPADPIRAVTASRHAAGQAVPADATPPAGSPYTADSWSGQNPAAPPSGAHTASWPPAMLWPSGASRPTASRPTASRPRNG